MSQHIWVLIDQINTQSTPSAAQRELLARATALSSHVTALVVGANVGALAQATASYGVQQVAVIDDANLTDGAADAMTSAGIEGLSCENTLQTSGIRPRVNTTNVDAFSVDDLYRHLFDLRHMPIEVGSDQVFGKHYLILDDQGRNL
jgi:hypothetical protein